MLAILGIKLSATHKLIFSLLYLRLYSVLSSFSSVLISVIVNILSIVNFLFASTLKSMLLGIKIFFSNSSVSKSSSESVLSSVNQDRIEFSVKTSTNLSYISCANL